MDETIPTMPASEAARLDREDAERRAHMERLPQDGADAATYSLRAARRLWRPGQHPVDTPGILDCFEKSGKNVE